MLKIAFGIVLGFFIIVGICSLAAKVQEKRTAKKIAKATMQEYADRYLEEHKDDCPGTQKYTEE
jgi:hypothetical protein